MSTVQAPEPDVSDAASTDPVSAKGLNGAVTVDGGLVTIRKGLVTRNTGIRGPSRIALRDVTDVRLEPATSERAGSLEFVANGARPGANGERTIAFAEASADQFDRVRARVQAALGGD